jgi:hypothetical protein
MFRTDSADSDESDATVPVNEFHLSHEGFSDSTDGTTLAPAEQSPFVSSVAMIPLSRRLEHTAGYIALGMLDEASDELEAVEGADRLSAVVMAARIDLYVAAKNWDLLLAVSRELVRQVPNDDRGWIHAAFALRELNRVAEARAVLLGAEPVHGKVCGLLHYNLACYECLLGETAEAKRRLALACTLDRGLKTTALDDPDLKALRDEIATKP